MARVVSSPKLNLLNGIILFQPKIFNDPVFGFITIPDPFIQQLIDHPHFQRLGRISQVGLSHLVYPGARHTRFHHALGAMHLMTQAMDSLGTKGVAISREERRAVQIAILLHDIGHGPFSHTLENTILEGYMHEEISLFIMQRLNEQYHLELETAISIFQGNYPRKFFHQLVSGQLDADRLDYLMRDSFYTGVAEGVIGSERIIKMMNVDNDRLVIEEKGIYSIEKFLIARRLMYWQVYLHKAVLGAEMLLTQILRRAKELAREGKVLFATTPLRRFLYAHESPFAGDDEKISTFMQLDDHDVLSAIKEWRHAGDRVLSDLCSRLIDRRLMRVRLYKERPDATELERIQAETAAKLGMDLDEAKYYTSIGDVSNQAYDAAKDDILIRMKDGRIIDLFEASDHLSRENMGRLVKKYFICCLKEIRLS